MIRYQTNKFGKSKSSALLNDLRLPPWICVISYFIFDVKTVIKDDTAIYLVGKNVDELVETMNSELNGFNEWLSVSELKLNASKRRYMVLGPTKIENVNQLGVDSAIIDVVSEIK